MNNKDIMVYLNFAAMLSKNSPCKRRKVGCIILSKDERILGQGYNADPLRQQICTDKPCYRQENNIPSGEELDKCYAVHAEQVAIMAALATTKNVCDFQDSMAFINCPPCLTCLKMLAHIGVKYVYCYDDGYESNSFTDTICEKCGVHIRRFPKTNDDIKDIIEELR